MVDCTCLENRRTAMYPGFESLSLRHATAEKLQASRLFSVLHVLAPPTSPLKIPSRPNGNSFKGVTYAPASLDDDPTGGLQSG